MMARAGVAALITLNLAACGGNSEPVPDVAETATPKVEAVATVVKSGEDIYKKCIACHTIVKGGSNGIGPALHGVVGRKVASAAGYTYSSAMAAKSGIWDEAVLDAYIAAPAKAVSGTKMMFAGINDAAERKALIDYLASQK